MLHKEDIQYHRGASGLPSLTFTIKNPHQIIKTERKHKYGTKIYHAEKVTSVLFPDSFYANIMIPSDYVIVISSNIQHSFLEFRTFFLKQHDLYNLVTKLVLPEFSTYVNAVEWAKLHHCSLSSVCRKCHISCLPLVIKMCIKENHTALTLIK